MANPIEPFLIEVLYDLIDLGLTQLKLEKSEKWGVERASPAQHPIFRNFYIELRKS
jgi:hypothetical protein